MVRSGIGGLEVVPLSLTNSKYPNKDVKKPTKEYEWGKN